MTDDPGHSAVRARAERFLASPAFERYYELAHVTRRFWIGTLILLFFTPFTWHLGFRAFARRKRMFDTPELRARYHELPRIGTVVQGHVVTYSSALHSNPEGRGPALLLASLDGTAEADAAAETAWSHVVEHVMVENPRTPLDRTLARMVADEDYRPTRKRAIPAALARGHKLAFLDVWMDNRLVRGTVPRHETALYLLVDPRPNGLVLPIPDEDRIG